MSFTTLRPLIQSILEGVTELSTAYDYHTENSTGYPYATHEPTILGNEYFTTTDNLRTYSFDIIIYQEMTKAGRDQCIASLCAAVDAVVTAFDEDTTLRTSGGMEIVEALPGTWGEFISKAGPVKFARMTLACTVEVTVV